MPELFPDAMVKVRYGQLCEAGRAAAVGHFGLGARGQFAHHHPVDRRVDGGAHPHSQAVADLAVAIGRRLGWAEARLAQLRIAAILHDVGKVAIPDELLRKEGVVGKFVEFFGHGVSALPLADRATIGNMSPEFGSTAAIFPID